MTLIEAYKRYWKKAFVMKGRARRKEYWSATLFTALISIVIGIIFAFVDSALGYELDTSAWAPSDTANAIWGLINIVPSFTVTARRLQDININGWWSIVPHFGWLLVVIGAIAAFMLLGAAGIADPANLGTWLVIVGILFFIMIIVAIVFFVFAVLDSKPGPNKYGEDPKRDERYYYPEEEL
ncbi:DUF805 domain-containing protein [Macrococcus hajekii]|uniref:DUF805 domain-containing protein n=1 Tax=Macrococcus hajekii TaxID=198482 RepID=A0A4R6BLP2_9STAP|nr:DUF805 domain-containing protein [Macrococcus hajekii]TDM02618.1 DUF805 domain-containing protein [Macrococcus hajekii]GGB02525.1 hypothetical protein GCM10007190_08100 [Macrococcus hajekii]